MLLTGIVGPAVPQEPAWYATSAPRAPLYPDTIYRLRLDPASHPGIEAVWLLSEVVLRLERDGSGARSYRTVVQVLHPEALEGWAEQVIGYDPARESFVLERARVVSPTGTIVSERPLSVREDSTRPAHGYGARREVRVQFAPLAVGSIVDLSYTVMVSPPLVSGDYTARWQASPGGLVRRTRLVLDAPSTLQPHIVAEGLSAGAAVEVRGGRTVRTWELTDPVRAPSEPFAPSPLARVSIAGDVSWTDVGAWYAALVRGSYAETPAVRAALTAAVQGERARVEALRRVHRMVAQDVRYADVAYEMYGYLARRPDEVLASMVGDCKDRTTLFVTLARMLGFEAYPVLVSTTGALRPELPGVAGFDHVIATVRLPGGWHYVDLTSALTRFDDVAALARGGYGLRVHDDGTSVMVAFPAAAPAENRSHVRVAGTLAADGTFTGRFERTATGTQETQLRTLLAEPLSAERHAQYAREIAADVIARGVADSLQLFAGRDLSADARVRLWLHAAHVAQGGGRQRLLALPLDTFGSPAVIEQLERAGARTQPLDAAKLFGPKEVVAELSLELPVGWRAELPPEVSARSVFGTYESSYRQVGRTLRIRRVLRGSSAVAPASAVDELLAWLRQVAADDVAYMVLTVS